MDHKTNQNKSNQNEPKQDEYISLVYKHPSVIICEENNYKYVKIMDDIKFGELLIIEHTYANNTDVCRLLIENNEFLFNQYHPRISTYTETADKFIHATKKLKDNCFGMDNGDKIITSTITMLNCSCDPNCAVHIQEKYNLGNTHIIFMELFAVRSIKKNTELTICYGPETAHKRDFNCDCGKSLEERIKIFATVMGLSKTLSSTNSNIIKEKIYKYLETNSAKKILLNHYLTTKGIFMNKNTISAYTSDGEKIINDIVHKFMGLNDNIGLANKVIIEKTMNQHKINMFLMILNNNLLS